MTIIQVGKLNMYFAVRNFMILYEGILKLVPNLQGIYATLLNIISEIQAIAGMQKMDKRGLAIEKKILKEKLITMADDYSRKITAYAKFSNNFTLLNEAKFSKTDFLRMSDVAMNDYLQIIYNKAESNIGNLSEYGIQPEMQKIFIDTITAFNKALSSPRTGIAEKAEATKKLALLFDSADSIIENMDFAVGVIKLTQPDFYNGYKSVRKIVDTNSGNIALKAMAIDLTNKEPIKGAIFTFRPQGIKVSLPNGVSEMIRKTAEKGSFRIKNMQSGTYKVLVTKPGYKEKEVTVSVADGERSDLNVEMEKA